MKRPAIFFDRDNTLIVSDGYLGDPARLELVPGAADAVARARELGYAIVVFSNQSGVARGLFTEDDVKAVNARLDEMLQKSNRAAIIDRHEYCPFHPQAVLEEYRKESDLRKPQPGMIHRAEQEMGLDLSRSWVIGDAPRDIEAGIAAGCGTILFKDSTLPPSDAAEEESTAQPDETVSSLKDAIDFIESSSDPVYQKVKAKPVSSDSSETRSLPEPQLARLERITEQILQELRRGREAPVADFSVPRLLAGIMQVVTLAVLFMCYLNRGAGSLVPLLLLALLFQVFTIALLIMGRLK